MLRRIHGYLFHTRACVHNKSLQSCLALWDPVDCSQPDSSVLGILQARILEWAAISFSNFIFNTMLFFFTQIYTVLTTESSFSWLICPFNINLCVCVCLCVYLGLLTSQHAPGSSCILVLLQVKNKTFIKEHHFISGKLY